MTGDVLERQVGWWLSGGVAGGWWGSRWGGGVAGGVVVEWWGSRWVVG